MALSVAASVRPAAVAGMFYPGNAPQLEAEVAELLDGVENFEPRLGYPKALIVPHAGYVYSGPIAARCWETRARFAVASFTPAMFFSSKRRAIVETDMSTIERGGML